MLDLKRNEKYMSSEEINSYFSFTFWIHLNHYWNYGEDENDMLWS